MHFKKTAKRFVAFMLALITVLSIPISAGAISYDGTGTSGKGTANSSGTGAYGIYSTTLSSDLVGYRFTGIKADGTRAGKTESLDVIFNDSVYPNPDDNLVVMQPKYSKLEIYNAYKEFVNKQGSTLELSDYAVFGQVQAASVGLFGSMTDGRTIWESQLGLPSGSKLPKNAEALGTWQLKDTNLDPIAKKIGYPKGVASMNGGDKIIAEPLYVAKLEGKDHAVTPSELALYAALTMTEHRLDIMNDDGATYISDACPTFIRKYTNYWFPNSYRTPNGQGLWPAASALPAVSGDVDAAERATYGTILGNGYGVVIMYTDSGPALPDYYIGGIRFYDSSGKQRDPGALPLNTDIYVVVDYNCTTKTSVKGNLYFYQQGSGTGFSMDLQNGGHTSWKTIKGYNCLEDEGSRWQSKVAYGEITSSSHWGYYTTTDGGSRLAQSYGSSTSKKSYIIMTLRSSTDSFGYVAAQIQKAYDAVAKKDYPNATTDHDANPNNNKMKISYRFAKTISRDIEISSIVLKDESGAEYSNYKEIPFGATVRVFHKYRSNSKSNGLSVGEPAVTGYAAGHEGAYYPLKINGNSSFALETGYTYHEVGSFTAGYLIDQNIYGAIYITGDTARSNDDSPKIESTYNNNQKSTTWRAKCNIRLHQIIFHDGNGKTYKTKTYGETYSAPTFQVGQTVYVTYVYKNTSQGGLYVNGTNTEGNACKKYKAPGDTSYTTNEVMYVAPGKTISVVGGSFTVKSGGGKVTGAVHVDRGSYGIPSSKSVSWYETNANDNTMEATYSAVEPVDLEIVKIQYKYTLNGVDYTTKTVARGSTTAVEIPLGATVEVWYTFKNGSSKTVKIDGYWAHNKKGTADKPGTLMTGSKPYFDASDENIGAGATLTVSSGSFTASQLGEAYYYGAVFEWDKTDANHEEDTQNNTMTAKYKVVGYDVAITDIYFKDAAGTEYSKGNDSAEMDYGKNYKIYYTIKNNSTSPVYVNVYNDIEPGNGIGVCVTPAAQATTGIRLEVGQSRDVYVGDWDAADQMIGVNPVGASVFLGTNTSATNFTYDGKTGTEANTANNIRTEEVTLKFDVAITEIYHTLPDGTRLSDDYIPAGTTVQCHYVLKNNSGAPVKVNVYYETGGSISKISVGGKDIVVELGAFETVDVIVKEGKYTVPNGNSRDYTFTGHLYREGQEVKKDIYEKTFDNNYLNVTITAQKVPYLTAIKPNADYRIGTDVISSFYLHNPTNYDYTGVGKNNTLVVTFTIKDPHGNVVYGPVTQNAIVPKNVEGSDNAQLVFFKWSVPEGFKYNSLFVEAELFVNRLGFPTSALSDRRYTCSGDAVNTPDTQYESRPPSNWQSLVSARPPANETGQAAWAIWNYNAATKKWSQNWFVYYVEAGSATLSPVSQTSYQEGAQYYMKSGYGVYLWCNNANARFVVGRNESTSDMCTGVQYAYATWQEYGYSQEEGCITTMDSFAGGNLWQLPGYLDYNRSIHFTPIWYPDTGYTAYACFSDIWTPMGMITVAGETNTIQVRQNMYDDWYIGHG